MSELQNWLLTEGRRLLSDSESFKNAKLTAAQKVAIAQQLEFRKRSSPRFPFPEKWLWSDRSLSQASDWLSACFKATLFPDGVAVVDGCCGAGADAVALANGRQVCAVDNDPWMVAISKSNAAAHGRTLSGVVAPFDRDAIQNADWLHVDPDRRASGRKTLEDSSFSPSLINLLELSQSVSGALVKIAPSTQLSEKSLEVLNDGWARLWLGSRGECRQQVLARGDVLLSRLQDRLTAVGLKQGVDAWSNSIAVLLAKSETECDHFEEVYYCGSKKNVPPSIPTVPERVGPFLADLNPTLFAANLHHDWVADNELYPISSEFGYYSADKPLKSPWASFYELLDDLPWDDRIVRKWLKANDAGLVEVKCRLVKFEASLLQKRLSQSAGLPFSLLVTRIGPKVRCLVCRRVVDTRESCCP